MKKKLALIILLVLAVTLLASCRNPDATKTIPRWSENAEEEVYEYNVTLADFAQSGDTRFTKYSHNDAAYFKDFAIATGEAMDSLDEVRPKALDGTYSIKITYNEETKRNTVVTSMDINVTYEYKDGKIKIADNTWVDLIDSIANNTKLVVATDSVANTITLKSTTATMVEFAHNEKQAPYQSSTNVNGFYIGKTHQEASSYDVSTEYDYEGKNATAKITLALNGGQPSTDEYTIKRYTEGSFIDSNQLFTYARSFDKTASSFADSPNAAVYNPMDHAMHTANFVFTPSANALLTNDTAQLYVKVPTLGVLVDGTPLMIQIAAPNMLDEKGKGSDRVQFGASWYAKHTPLRFRSGYMSFELNYQVGTPNAVPQQGEKLWNALDTYANKKD